MLKHRLQATDEVYCVALSSDGRVAACGCGGGNIIMWRASDGKLLHTFKAHEGDVSSLDFSKDGKWLVSGGGHVDRTVKVWALHGEQAPTLQQTLEGHTACVFAVVCSPDVTMIASASYDGTVRVWSVPSGELLQTYSGHEGAVYCAAWSPDSKRVASGGEDKAVHLWDVAEARLVMQPLQGHGVTVMCAAFGADCSLLVSGSGDKTIIIWELAEGREATVKLRLVGHMGSVRAIALSPCDRHVVSASYDGTVRVWKLATGQQVRVLEGHLHYVHCVAWSGDGALIASGGLDQQLCLWEADVQDFVMAFMMGTHSRLGAGSPVLPLDRDVAVSIAQMIIADRWAWCPEDSDDAGDSDSD